MGSIPFSYLFTRVITRQDIRSRGSGNVGATNVFRTSGPGVALL
ncbi:MAG: glycerol-3-phosphate acyltransferase, partial [Syntrophomonas sp.]|nr:glycerol-3-phosphate acyltransferase [Syntrophomonas sp.]